MSADHPVAADWRRHPSYGAVAPLELLNDDRPCTRLVVVAAHPDDETLGAGGLIAAAADAGLQVYVVLLTAGEASPKAPRAASRHALASLRLAEMENALARLAPDSTLVYLGAPDGQLGASEAQIAASLTGLIGDGSATLLVAPWRADGHDDHEATGRAAATAATASGARLLEYPLLAWSRLHPGDLPWRQAACLRLSDDRQARKRAAINAHVSQVRAIGGRTDEVALPPHVLAHFTTGIEHFLVTDPAPPAPPAEPALLTPVVQPEPAT